MRTRMVFLPMLVLGLSATGATLDAPLLTHPDASWSLRLDLPGFQFGPQRISRDHSQAWSAGTNKATGVSLTPFIDKQVRFRSTAECKDYYVKRLAAAKRKTTSSDYKDWAVAEDVIEEKAPAPAAPRTLHAYLYHDSFCVDVELTKDPYRPEDRDLLLKTLDGLSEVPASKAEMARAAACTPLSGPEEQTALEAARRMRARDFPAAEALLQTLCPEARRTTPEGRTLADCALRNAGLSEARNINQGRDLATLYWRAGDLLAKDGRSDAAIEVFRKGLDIQPDHADIWYSMGMAQRDKKDLPGAGATLNKALALRPNDARTMLALATNLMDQGKLVEADAMLDRVEKADARESQVWLRRGEVMMQRGRYNEAIAIFDKAKTRGVDENTVRARIQACKEALALEKKRNTPTVN